MRYTAVFVVTPFSPCIVTVPGGAAAPLMGSVAATAAEAATPAVVSM